MGAARLRRGLPLRVVLVVLIVVPVVALAAAVGYLARVNGRRTVEELAGRISVEVARGVALKLDTYLGQARTVNAMNADAFREGLLRPDDPVALVRHFQRQGERFPGLGTIAFAGGDGSFVGANHAEGYLVHADPVSTGGAIRRHRPVPAGDLSGPVLTERAGYDPRRRGWYRAAAEAGRGTWAGISPSVTGVRLDLTAVEPVRDDRGGLWGVLMLDISLAQVSAFLRGLEVGASGQVFVVEPDGAIVASSFDERPYVVLDGGRGELRRLRAAESRSAMIRGAAGALAARLRDGRTIGGAARLSADIGGAPHFVEILPYANDGLDLLIVTVLPEADFLGHTGETERLAAALGLAATLLALVLGIRAANRVAGPLVRLSAAARQIGAGTWVAPPPLERDDEVGELSRSFHAMSAQIRRLVEDLQGEVGSRAGAEAEARAAMRRAQDEQERTRAILASIGNGVSIQDRDFRVLYQNQIHKDMIGEHAGELCFAAYEGRDALCDGCPVARSFADGEIHHSERVVSFPDGKRHFEITASPLRDATGEIVAGIELVRDVTERVRITEAIAAEKERLAVTLRSIGDAVVVTDLTGTVTLINRPAEAITGWGAAEAVGRPVAEILTLVADTPARERVENPVAVVLRTGRMAALGDRTSLVRRDGSEVVVEDSAAPVRDAHSRVIGAVLVFRDVTERRRLEEELVKSQKLESLGILAGGLAHDFNNLLTSILGNISVAQVQVGPGHRALGRLEAAEGAAVRATDLTRQLLTFARGGNPVKKTAAIAAIVREAVGFALSGASVAVEYDLPDSVWPVEVDAGQMSQVFTNLAVNAVQAMPGGGTLAVRARNATLEEGEVAPLPAGEYVEVSVSDTGAGIPEDFLLKIFDPFFTTKQRGSGLGLSTAYAIVTRHGGRILVASRPGAGTTFRILLRAAPDRAVPGTAPAGGLARGRGAVLVMDDEDGVREAAAEMLRELGYEPALARDGEEALGMYRAARAAGRPFGAVVLDLTIPGGLGGKETLAALRELDPEVRAVVSSGYSNDPVLADHAAYGFRGVIAKPYTIAAMSRALREVLEAPGGAP